MDVHDILPQWTCFWKFTTEKTVCVTWIWIETHIMENNTELGREGRNFFKYCNVCMKLLYAGHTNPIALRRTY